MKDTRRNPAMSSAALNAGGRHTPVSRQPALGGIMQRIRLAGRLVIPSLLCCALAACNGMEARDAKQAARMHDFEATAWDYEVIARAAIKTIESKGDVTAIVVPNGLDPRALDALRHVHPIVRTAPGPAGTLPAGYFRVSAFTIEDGAAEIDGQLGPATGLMTAANMRDCGKGYSVSFYLEGGDWVSHAYKTTTCAESRNWTPADDASSAH